MHRTNAAVPRQVDVPLHIRVEREEIAVRIHREVIGVPKAAAEDQILARLPVPTRQHAAGRHDAGRVPAGVHIAVQQLRLVVVRQRRVRIHQVRRHARMVAEDHHRFAVRPAANGVGPVFAHRAVIAVHQFTAVRHVVAIAIRATVDTCLLPLLIHAHRVEGPPVPPHALQVADGRREHLLCLVAAVAVTVFQDYGVPAFLGHRRAAQRVEGQRDQRACLFRSGHLLNGESVRYPVTAQLRLRAAGSQ